MRNFTLEDLSGAGQYLVRLCPTQLQQIVGEKPIHLSNTGFLSTIMFKVGYGNFPSLQSYVLISMADGWVQDGYFKGNGDNQEKILFTNKQSLVDYLNTNSEEYRFATQEEVVRVVMYQKSRWRN